MDYDLDYFDLENKKLTALENHFGAKVLPMYLEKLNLYSKENIKNALFL